MDWGGPVSLTLEKKITQRVKLVLIYKSEQNFATHFLSS